MKQGKDNRSKNKDLRPTDSELPFPETVPLDQATKAFYEAHPEFRTQSAGDYIPPFVKVQMQFLRDRSIMPEGKDQGEKKTTKTVLFEHNDDYSDVSVTINGERFPFHFESAESA